MSDNNSIKDRISNKSSELELHHYNWAQFDQSMTRIHQVKFNLAGAELVAGKEIDWVSRKPKAENYCLQSTTSTEITRFLENENDEQDNDFSEKVLINKKLCDEDHDKNSSDDDDGENKNPSAESGTEIVLSPNKVNNNKNKKENITKSASKKEKKRKIIKKSKILSLAAKARNLEIESTTAELQHITKTPALIDGANKIELYKLRDTIRDEVQQSFNVLHEKFSGNIAGLQSYINDVNNWQKELALYETDKRKLWGFLQSKLSRKIECHVVSKEEYGNIEKTLNTCKLYQLLKLCTLEYRNISDSNIRNEWRELKQIDYPELTLSEFINKFDSYIIELEDTELGPPQYNERMKQFLGTAIHQKRYETLVNTHMQNLFTEASYNLCRKELLAVDMKLNLDNYGPPKSNKKGSSGGGSSKFQAHIASSSDNHTKETYANVAKTTYNANMVPECVKKTNDSNEVSSSKKQSGGQKGPLSVATEEQNPASKKRKHRNKCFNCGKNHATECTLPKKKCEKCHELGHKTSYHDEFVEKHSKVKLNSAALATNAFIDQPSTSPTKYERMRMKKYESGEDSEGETFSLYHAQTHSNDDVMDTIDNAETDEYVDIKASNDNKATTEMPIFENANNNINLSMEQGNSSVQIKSITSEEYRYHHYYFKFDIMQTYYKFKSQLDFESKWKWSNICICRNRDNFKFAPEKNPKFSDVDSSTDSDNTEYRKDTKDIIKNIPKKYVNVKRRVYTAERPKLDEPDYPVQKSSRVIRTNRRAWLEEAVTSKAINYVLYQNNFQTYEEVEDNFLTMFDTALQKVKVKYTKGVDDIYDVFGDDKEENNWYEKHPEDITRPVIDKYNVVKAVVRRISIGDGFVSDYQSPPLAENQNLMRTDKAMMQYVQMLKATPTTPGYAPVITGGSPKHYHDDESKYGNMVHTELGIKTPTSKENFIIDSGASISVFKSYESMEGMILNSVEELAETDESHSLYGIAGKRLRATHKGNIQGLGLFVIVPDATQNLISISQLQDVGIYEILFGDGCIISYKYSNTILLKIKKSKNNLYLATKDEIVSMSALENYSQEAFIGEINTQESDIEEDILSENEKHYSKEQVERAKEVIKLHQSLDHPSNITLINALNNGIILGTRLTSRDVTRSEEMYGKCNYCMAGKITRPSYKSSTSKPAENVGSIIHVDIYPFSEKTIGGNMFSLISVDEFSCYMYVVMIKSKSMLALNAAFDDIISHYSLNSHIITQFNVDSESNLGACTQHVNTKHIALEQCPPYQHEQRIERYIRTINNRLRAVLVSLPYSLPKELYGELLSSVTIKHNDLPNSSNTLKSPRMIVLGTKLDIHETAVIPFGTLCMFHMAGNENLNKWDARSQLGVSLGPSRRSRQSIRAYIIQQNPPRVKVRSHYTILNTLPPGFAWIEKPVSADGVEQSQAIYTMGFQLINRVKIKTHETQKGVSNRANQLSRQKGVPQDDPDNDKTEHDESENDNHVEEIDLTANKIRQSPNLIEAVKGSSRQKKSTPQKKIQFNNERNVNPSLTMNKNMGTTPLQKQSKLAEKGVSTSQTPSITGKKRKVSPQLQIPSIDVKKKTNISITLNESSAKVKPQQRTKVPNIMKTNTNVVTRDKLPRAAQLRNWEDASLTMSGYSLSVKKALLSEYAQQTREAVCDEIKNFLDYKVGHYVRFSDIPVEHRKSNILSSFMFIKHKSKPDGRYDKTKARLVGDGSKQDKHMYEFIASTTISLSVVFILFNIASFYKCQLVSYDIKGAFLHASFTPADEPTYLIIRKEVVDIWVNLDPTSVPFVNSKGDLLLLLDKFVYGLKQSPIKFQEHLRKVLKNLGYQQSEYDDCLHVIVLKDKFSIISTHVDDILQVTNSSQLVEDLHTGLNAAYGEVQFNPEAESYLGMNITRSMDGHTVQVDHSGSIAKLIKEHLTDKDTVCRTPHQEDLFEVQDDEKSDNSTLGPNQSKKFLSIVMSLMYIARLTRPDILLPVTYLASRSHYATQQDWLKLVRVLRYMKGTVNLGITVQCTDLQLHCHCDASYGVHADGRSHTGFVVYMGKTLSYMHAKSNKQKTGSTSSTDAEIIALVDSMKVVVWLKNILLELDREQPSAAVVYQDNKSGMVMVTDVSKCSRSKHILTKINYAKDLVNSCIIQIEYLNTNDMSSDLLTKPLGGNAFFKHRNTIMGYGGK